MGSTVSKPVAAAAAAPSVLNEKRESPIPSVATSTGPAASAELRDSTLKSWEKDFASSECAGS